MSDFDKIINDRLNDDDDGDMFPHREANWDMLSQRLADFEAANPLPKPASKPVPVNPAPPLRPVWRQWSLASAAAALVGVSGLLFWHFNKLTHLEQDNAQLKQEIAALKVDMIKPKLDTVFENRVVIQTDTIYQTTKTIINHSNITSKKQETLTVHQAYPSVSTDFQPEQKQVVQNEHRQNAAVFDNNVGVGKNETKLNATTSSPKESNKIDIPVAPSDNHAMAVVENKGSGNTNAAASPQTNSTQTTPSVLKTISESNNTTKAIEKEQNTLPPTPKTNDIPEKINSDNSGTKNIAKTEPLDTKTNEVQVPSDPISTVVGKEETLDVEKTTVTGIQKTKEDSAIVSRVAQEETKKTEEIAKTVSPIIKTDKVWKKFLPVGFAVGVNGFYGSALPQIVGINPTTGGGLTAQLALSKNFSLVANADWVETNFEVRERPQHFHVKDDPNPPKQNVDLHHIKGDQHNRLLSLNIKYAFGQKLWAQPSIFVGHSWQKNNGYDAKFVFKDISTGDETSIPVPVQAEKIKSLWQAGVGIEKRIQRWSFAITGEVQKDLSNPTDINGKALVSTVGILRGGVKFNIF